MNSVFFSEIFSVPENEIENYGAFNISLLSDMPLFIDPFLIFNNQSEKYQDLHNSIIKYVDFLREKVENHSDAELERLYAWFVFPEVKQTWLGVAGRSNNGIGLGIKFARQLQNNLRSHWSNLEQESITKGSHLEKLTLFNKGIGHDKISDFTTNLIKGYLLEYTSNFARQYINPSLRRNVAVRKARFNYQTETWESQNFDLPVHKGDYVILTPVDILSKHTTWITRNDLIEKYMFVVDTIPNGQLRAEINNFFNNKISDDAELIFDRRKLNGALEELVNQYPDFIDYYIRYKENMGEEAKSISRRKVYETFVLHFKNTRNLAELIQEDIYSKPQPDNYQEWQNALRKAIEEKRGYEFLYIYGKPIQSDIETRLFFKHVWSLTQTDVYPNDLLDFKLASNMRLDNDAKEDSKALITYLLCYSEAEAKRMKLNVHSDNIVVIEAFEKNISISTKRSNRMTGIEPITLGAISKAVDFLFDQAGKLLEERRENRKRMNEDDDTKEDTNNTSYTKKEEVKSWTPKNVYLKDLPQEIDSLLSLIHRYRGNKRDLEMRIANDGGFYRSPTSVRNELRDSETEIKESCQRLKGLIEEVYGHKITIIGLN